MRGIYKALNLSDRQFWQKEIESSQKTKKEKQGKTDSS